MLVEERDYSFILAPRVLDVDAAAHFGSAPEGFAEVAAEERVRAQSFVIGSRDDGVQRDDARGNEVGGGLDHVARRRLDATDDPLDGGERAEPVRRVREVWAGDAWEEILRAPCEARDLVRHGRAEDEDGVVEAGREQPVEVHRHSVVD